jgi:phthiocerol/phenolphthiocerol synthesis type-I polyketide synthase D/polyketide synthase PksN
MNVVNNIKEIIIEFICRETNLSDDEVDSDINFGAFGMSSVTSTKLIGILEDKLSVCLSPTMIFDFPTIDELSLAIEQKLSTYNKASVSESRDSNV